MQRTAQDVLDPIGKQVISTLNNTVAQGLTLPTSADGVTVIAKRARISVETQAIRYYETGDTPTSSDGHPVAAGVTFFVEGANALIKFSAIGQAASAKLTITYYG